MATSHTIQPGLLETDLYRLRFSDAELKRASRIWKPICAYLQQWVAPGGTTLDLGSGHCHFINNIASAERIALDINEGTLRRYAAPDVRTIACSGADLADVDSDSVDTVFASNVYEHFPSREEVARSFKEVLRVLKPGGRFLILQPNFRYCMKRYFDFFDHRLSFTHQGMIEGLDIYGFQLEKAIDRFLPYTTKSSFPKVSWLVSLYLRLPAAWKVLGAQMLIVARKPS